MAHSNPLAVQLIKGKDDQHYFHVRAGNGEIVLNGEGYTREASMMDTFRLLAVHASAAFARFLGRGDTADVLAEVYLERLRQITEKGYTPEDDDGQHDGSLAMCAGLICLPEHQDDGGDWWHWRAQHVCQNYDRRYQLIIAQALLAAEVERLDRKAAREQGQG